MSIVIDSHTLILCFMVIQHLPIQPLEQRPKVRIPAHLLGIQELIIRSPCSIISIISIQSPLHIHS